MFKKIFRLAFPERPEEKLDALIEKIRNVEKTDGSIPIHSIAMLIYLFCDGKTEDSLGQMFNLFDTDGNGTISISELLNMQEFITGMTQHPVTKKILEVKTIDALLATF